MAASAGISNLTEIANLLGGQRTTQRVSANTGPLEQAVAALSQQQDPAAQLTSIFQQALGAMPQLQARYSNAVGARTGGNAAVQTSLDKLLQDTVIKGQAQVAQQDLSRQSAAANAAANLAQATRNVTTQQGTNLQRAGGVLGALQLGSQLYNSPMGRKATDKIGGFFDSLGTDSGTVDTASLPDGGMSFAPQQDLGFDNISQGVVDFGGGFDFGSGFDFGGSADGAVDAGNSDAWDYVLEFADGGLVGRDGNKPTVARAGGARRSAAPSYETNQIQQATAINAPTEELPAPKAAAAPASQATGGTGNGVAPGTQLQMPEGRDLARMLMSALGGPLAFGATVGDMEMKRAGVNTSGFGLRDALTLANEAANPINKAVALLKGANALMAPPKQSTQTGGTSAGASAGAGGTAVQQGGQTYYQSRGPSGFNGGAFGTQNSSPTGFGQPSFNFTTGEATAASTPAAATQAYARGGEVKGPGTGTSDSIPARLSDGEYVIPADVVERIGVAFFDSLKDRFHEPSYVEDVEQEAPGEKKGD